MSNILQAEYNPPVSRAYATVAGAAVTVLALVGGLIVGIFGGSLTFHTLVGKAPDPLTYTLAALIFFGGTLGGSALWGAAMARLAGSPARWRAAKAGMLGFVPITFILNLVLAAAEQLVERAGLPLHRMFTVLFVPSAFLIAGASTLALAWALRWRQAAAALAVRVGIAAALAFVCVNLAMEALGWLIGAPGAAERGTMITVLLAGNLGAALAGGAVLGAMLRQPGR
jgi:hypothetical protein